MPEQFLGLLDKASHGISLFGVGLIVIGFARAAIGYAVRLRSGTAEHNFNRFMIDLGHSLALVLDVLVLAIIIDTIVVRPTFHSLAVLAFTVVVRTILLWNLFLQTEGRWPWQAPAKEQVNA